MQTQTDKVLSKILTPTPDNGSASQEEVPNIEQTGETTSNQDIVLISINRFGFGNRRKIDIKELNPNVSDRMISASKGLLDSDELRAINTACNNIVEKVRRKSVPATSILKKGTYAVMPEMVITAWQMLKEFKERELPPLIQMLKEAYPSLKEQAKEELKEFFDASQYPDVDELCERFDITWKFFTIALPNPDSIKSPITNAFFQEAQQQAADEFKEFLEEAKTVLRVEMLELVNKMEDILTPGPGGKKKRIHDSTVEKLEQFLTDFASRNIANDSALQEAVEQCKAFLKGKSVDTLRRSQFYRDKIKDSMQNIGNKLERLVEEMPMRNIIRD